MFIFFFNDTATTEIYTLSLHDALPIYGQVAGDGPLLAVAGDVGGGEGDLRELLGLEEVAGEQDRKSTRLNSSHANISYAVFCLKKKKKSLCSRWYSLSHIPKSSIRIT